MTMVITSYTPAHKISRITGFTWSKFNAHNCAYLVNFKCASTANASRIYEKWGIDVPVDKSSRRYDFVIKKGEELVIFETNFYGGGGSKLKSTAGEYRNLYDTLNNQFKFVWITDGAGWLTTTRPLRETFNHNDYIITLDMMEKGILDSIV